MFRFRYCYRSTASDWSKEIFPEKFQAFVAGLTQMRNSRDEIVSIVVKDFSKEEDI